MKVLALPAEPCVGRVGAGRGRLGSGRDSLEQVGAGWDRLWQAVAGCVGLGQAGIGWARLQSSVLGCHRSCGNLT